MCGGDHVNIQERVEQDPGVKGAVLRKHGYVAVLDKASLEVAESLFDHLRKEVRVDDD